MTAFVALLVVLGGQSSASVERPDSFADLAEKLSPAVVNISTTMVVNGNNRPKCPTSEGSPFEDFFKEFQDRVSRLGVLSLLVQVLLLMQQELW